MLIASLVLHLGVALGLTLAQSHTSYTPAATSSGGTSESIILLRSEDVPDFHQPLSPQRSAANSMASLAPASLPSPSPLFLEKKVMTRPSPLLLALEANPNAHLRSLPPEAVLCPIPCAAS